MTVSISDELIDKVFDDIKKRCKEKIKQKGNKSFNSRAECMGKATEEFYETLMEMHKKDDKAMEIELHDLAIVCAWGSASLRATNYKGSR